jgi:penicillin-binding protein 1C
LPGRAAKERTILLMAEGGKEPLTWLVNGALIGSFDRFEPVAYAPMEEGPARVTVIDSDGRSDTAQVRFKRLH